MQSSITVMKHQLHIDMSIMLKYHMSCHQALMHSKLVSLSWWGMYVNLFCVCRRCIWLRICVWMWTVCLLLAFLMEVKWPTISLAPWPTLSQPFLEQVWLYYKSFIHAISSVYFCKKLWDRTWAIQTKQKYRRAIWNSSFHWQGDNFNAAEHLASCRMACKTLVIAAVWGGASGTNITFGITRAGLHPN